MSEISASDIRALMSSLNIETLTEQKNTCHNPACNKKYSVVQKSKDPNRHVYHRYCSITCRDKTRTFAKKQRNEWAEKKKTKKDKNQKITCYYLNKKIFPNKENAWAFIDERYPSDETITPYVCKGCNAIHIGHPKKGDKGNLARN